MPDSLNTFSAVPGTIEAESGAVPRDDIIQSDVPGFSGTGYVALGNAFNGTDFASDFFDDGELADEEPADAVSFDLEVAENGWYTLNFRYSNDSGETLWRDLRIDGETLPGIMAFEDQFANYDWSNAADRVYFDAGEHIVTLTSELSDEDPATAEVGGELRIDNLTVTKGVTPSDHISARSLLMNDWSSMVAIHESAQEDPEDTEVFGPELRQIRHEANWEQNQIDSGQLWLKGTDDNGNPANYGPQFDSDLYFDESGILNVDYNSYLPTDEELFVDITKEYAMVPEQSLLVERYTFLNNKPLGAGLETWEMMNRLSLPDALKQKAVWDERREAFIVELEQENGQDPLYLAFGAYQEMDGQDIEVQGTVDSTPTAITNTEDPDLLDPSALEDEPRIADQFYGAGLEGDLSGEGEGVDLGMSTEIELYPTRPIEYYFYYTVADSLDGLDQQISTALNPNDNTVLNSPEFWFTFTEEKWEDRMAEAVDPTQGARPVEDDALITGYDRTLVTILQSQQPEFGSFVAATNPSYEFNAWPRDGAATAIALDGAGLVDEAEDYWKWMASIEEDGDGDPLFENGTFYTNYSFWNADEPIDFVQPEWDAQGLFLIGAYKHAEKLRELGRDEQADAFLKDEVVKQALIDSAEFIENNIDPEKGFGPAEFSIWESFFAHNGFTQVTYASGLQAAALMAEDLGISDARKQAYIDGAQTIKRAIERPTTDPDFPGLWNEEDGYFVWGVTEDGNVIERPNAALDLMFVTGLFDIDDPKVQSQIDYITENLSNNTWGIARYDSDNFYAQSPFSPGGSYESNVDETSWPQMTSYVGMGMEFMGNEDWAYNSLEWTISRYAEGFMPPGEGVDPSLREPLPSTMVEPVTGGWYIQNLLNYTGQFDPRLPDPVGESGEGDDTIVAGNGDDTEGDMGGVGDDTLTGNEGDDTIESGSSGSEDVIVGGAGPDGNVDDETEDDAGEEDEDEAELAGGRVDGTNDADDLTGTDGNDAILGQDGDDTIDGAGGNDVIAASDGKDLVTGGAGNDAIGGGLGNDTLSGDGGDDILGGGQGDDALNGGEGNDIVASGAGNDTAMGAEGDDIMGGSFGADQVFGGDGDDVLGGGFGKDSISGGEDDDIIGGGKGDDALFGDDGNDFIAGGGRNDALSGGAGDDTINGGSGNDIMSGGEGGDIFVWNAADEGVTDRIVDFSTGEDLIRLSGVENEPGSGMQGRLDALEITDATFEDQTGVEFTYGGQTIQVIGVTSSDLVMEDFLFT